MTEVDYVIVGGGPIGLATAILARMAGRSALVVERHSGAVDKACGEGLMPPAVAMLRRLGVDVEDAGTHPFVGIRYIDDAVMAAARFVDGEGLGIRRIYLSDALIRRATQLDVSLWHRTEYRGFREDGGGVVIDTTRGEVRARWLVAADGLHSNVRKDAGFSVTTTKPRRFGIRQHFHVRPWSDFVEVHWGPGVEAYVTPTGPERVGVAFLWSGGKGDMETFLRVFPALSARLGPPEDEVRGAGPLAVEVETQRKGRVLLVGDAAGYLDAITGEGISLGLLSASALIETTLADRPGDYPAAYRAIVRRHLLFTRMLLAISRRAWLRRLLIRRLARHPRAMEAFLAFNAGAWGWGRLVVPALGMMVP